jgi:nitroreductase
MARDVNLALTRPEDRAMSSPKQATPNYPIQQLIARRWSPYALADRPVSNDDLRSVFEAARRSASSYNEQPWRYIVATKASPADYERLLSCLVEGNQVRVEPGKSSQAIKFTKEGEFKYHCKVHGKTMSGTIVVKAVEKKRSSAGHRANPAGAACAELCR